MIENNRCPPLTDYMKTYLYNNYNNKESISDIKLIESYNNNLIVELNSIKKKINNLVKQIGQTPLNDDDFNMLFTYILNINSDDI